MPKVRAEKLGAWTFTVFSAVGPVMPTFNVLSMAAFFLLKKTLGLKLLIALKLIMMLALGTFSSSVYRSYQQMALLPLIMPGPQYTYAAASALSNASELVYDNSLTGKDSTNPLVVENVLNFVKWLDERNCINRLLCEIGADEGSPWHGKYETALLTFFTTFEASQENAASYDYFQSMKYGRLSGSKMCTKQFAACTHNMKNILTNIQYLFSDNE